LHSIAIAGEYQRILSEKTGFTAEGGVSGLFCGLDDGIGAFGGIETGGPERQS
jgi:hypothetical protein